MRTECATHWLSDTGWARGRRRLTEAPPNPTAHCPALPPPGSSSFVRPRRPECVDEGNSSDFQPNTLALQPRPESRTLLTVTHYKISPMPYLQTAWHLHAAEFKNAVLSSQKQSSQWDTAASRSPHVALRCLSSPRCGLRTYTGLTTCNGL